LVRREEGVGGAEEGGGGVEEGGSVVPGMAEGMTVGWVGGTGEGGGHLG
jgi:hypothetical protein